MNATSESTETSPAVASDAGTSKSRPRKSRFGFPLWLLACLTIVSVVFVGLTLLLTGWVKGEEFSPSLCRTRRFSYLEVPILQLQVWPITRKTTTPDAARFLSQGNWWQAERSEASSSVPGKTTAGAAPVPAGVRTPVWHLVSVRHGRQSTQFDDAALLVQQLRRRDDSGKPYWKSWTKDHPKLGKVLWPAIFRLARRELYLMMPPLFESAAACEDAERLQAQINESLRRQYRNVIADMRAVGRERLAAELAREAATDFPADVELTQLADELSGELPSEAAAAAE